MATISLPNRPAGTDTRSIAQILADFDAILAQANGNLQSSVNVKVGVAAATLDGNTTAEGSSDSLARADHKHLIQGIEQRASQPTSGHFVGRHYFNTADTRVYVCVDAATPVYQPVVRTSSGADGRVLYIASGLPSTTNAPSDKQYLRSVGSVPTWQSGLGAFDIAPTTVDVTSTTAETSIYSKSIPGNTLGSTGVVRCTIIGDFLSNTGGSPTVRLRIKFGGTTIYDLTTSGIGSNGNRAPLHIEFALANLNATNAQHLNGTWNIGNRSTAPTVGLGSDAAAIFIAPLSSAAANPAIDTTTAQTLDVTIENSSNSGSLSVRKKYAVLEVLT